MHWEGQTGNQSCQSLFALPSANFTKLLPLFFTTTHTTICAMKIYFLAFVINAAFGQYPITQSVSPYYGQANPQLPLTYSPFAQPATLPTSSNFQYLQNQHQAYNPLTFAPQGGPFQFPATQNANPYPTGFNHPFTSSLSAGAASSSNALPTGTSNTHSHSNPSFMRLLLGSMGIHLGGHGRTRKTHKPPKPGSSGSTVLSNSPPGAGNAVHVNNHLQAIQGLAQQQHALVAEQTSSSPVEYQANSNEEVTILHHHYPPSGSGEPVITDSADPPASFQQASGPSNEATSPKHSAPMKASQLRPQPSGVLSSYESNYPTEKPHTTARPWIPSPVSKSRKKKPLSPLTSSLLTIYEQSKASIEKAQASYDQQYRGSSSPPLAISTLPPAASYKKPTVINASHADSAKSASSVISDAQAHDQPYHIIEKPVIHYIERPMIRFVERTVVKTIEKPVIKYIEKPVYRYIERPVSEEAVLNTEEVHSNTVTHENLPLAPIAPVQSAPTVQNASPHSPAPHGGHHEDVEEFEQSYGGTYVRKNRPSSIRIIPSTTLFEDNSGKSPVINIPQQLPAYSPGPQYEAVKTHYYGPTVSGKDIPGHSHQATQIEEAFLA